MGGRDYTPVLDRVRPGGDRDAVMRAVVDGLWECFGLGAGGLLAEAVRGDEGQAAMSWVGFYVWSRTAPEEMTLACRRDKPACSPIGLQGACGRCFTTRRGLVVTDVARLGAAYIACDPRDRSEVVVPCLNPDGTAWGVLDVDSYEVGAFDVFDALSLTRLLRYAGLSSGTADRLEDVAVV